MKAITTILLIFLVCLVEASAANIHYVGSSTVGKFIRDATVVYNSVALTMDTVPESAGGEKCAIQNVCDMGGVARDVKQEYLDQGVVATLIGKDALAVIVNADNPVTELSSDELKRIFTGEVANWSELGGPNLPMEVHIVKQGSATRKVFREVILQGEDYEGCTVTTPDAMVVSHVARNKGAIGQISFAFIKGKSEVRPLIVDGQEPTVNNPDYPITRNLFITTRGIPEGEVKAFLDWTLSPEGQQLVKERFVGIKK